MIYERLTIDTRSLQLIIALLCLVIITATVLYLLKPQYLNYNDKHVAHEMLSNQIHNQAQLQQSIDDTQTQIDDLTLQLHGEAGSMPVNEVEAYLVGRLQELAWDAGIELLGVRPGYAKRVMSFEEISFELDVEGGYDNVYDWLDKIDGVLGFMLVTEYKMSLASKKNSETLINMHVTIVFYRTADK